MSGYVTQKSYIDLTPKQIYRMHENEKKRIYSKRVTEIEQGTFTPLIFTTTGGMGKECLIYHRYFFTFCFIGEVKNIIFLRMQIIGRLVFKLCMNMLMRKVHSTVHIILFPWRPFENKR